MAKKLNYSDASSQHMKRSLLVNNTKQYNTVNIADETVGGPTHGHMYQRWQVQQLQVQIPELQVQVRLIVLMTKLT